ncbi:MAG: dehydrogenase [Candidatus Hydrogenedentota bacterium]
MKHSISRRTFIFMSAAAVTGCQTAGKSKPGRAKKISPNDKINFAAVGCGGKGASDIASCDRENIVALCDVDWNRAAATFDKYPAVKKYKDFREMLDKEKIEAMTVSTPDHMHAPVAMAAMERGIHVYVQKPMAHTVHEARTMTAAAKKYGVQTQMGNQGHSGEGVRQMAEMIWSGAIGHVREAHVWTNRPTWPQGIDRPAGSDTPPESLDWNLWLGPAPDRPYVAKHPVTGGDCYCPHVWRGWWDFGCGALGDMACHIMDPAFYCLHLGSPTGFELVMQEGRTDETGPKKSVLKFNFPERLDPQGNKLIPLDLYWYDGGELPPRPEGIPEGDKLGDGKNGSLFIGEKGCATAGEYGGMPRLLPDKVMDQYQRPEPTIPRLKGSHYMDWLGAIRGEKEHAGSHFDYAGPFTETVLLGNLAVRIGEPKQPFLWNGDTLQITNIPEANQYLTKQYRKGWEINL